MSVAIIQGASGGQGRLLARHILRNTGLKVYALTHASNPGELRDYLSDGSKDAGERLQVVENVSVDEERSLEDAAKRVKEDVGESSVRLVACLAGVLEPEKSLSAVTASEALREFKINALGHLLTYKHFTPLIPKQKQLDDLLKDGDAAKGLLADRTSLCWSLSARVGSIGANEKGGWYSYRSTKAALNQMIRTLDHELINRSSSAVAVAYHPGTVLTDFSKSVIGQGSKPNRDKGILQPEEAMEQMTKLMGQITRDGPYGGKFYDWRGETVEW